MNPHPNKTFFFAREQSLASEGSKGAAKGLQTINRDKGFGSDLSLPQK